MIKLELLRTFVRVAELGSFTQAAASLGMQKASASEHIQALEEALGARLLHRTTRRAQPTEDGLALYERCKDLLADADEVEALFRRDGAALAGRLRVDMPTVMARTVVMPHLAEFLHRYPNLRIDISSTDRRVDVVREGFDCVLRVGAPADDTLIARRLGAAVMMNSASPAYLDKYGMPQTLDDLERHWIVAYAATPGTRAVGFEYVQDGQAHEIPMQSMVSVNNAETYKSACLGGLGITQAPLSGLRADFAAGRLVPVLPDHVPAPMPIYLLYAHRRHLPQRVRLFMEWVTELLQRDLLQHNPLAT